MGPRNDRIRTIAVLVHIREVDECLQERWKQTIDVKISLGRGVNAVHLDSEAHQLDGISQTLAEEILQNSTPHQLVDRRIDL